MNKAVAEMEKTRAQSTMDELNKLNVSGDEADLIEETTQVISNYIKILGKISSTVEK